MAPLELRPDQFVALTDRVGRLAADFLAGLDEAPSFPVTSGAEVTALFGGPAPEQGLRDAALDDLASVARHSRAQNGRFFGYVLGSGEPIGALGDLLAAVLNQNITAWRSAPAGVTIERTVVGWLAAAIGCEGFSGSLCGGGSAANLMGLAMAREAALGANEASVGEGGTVYASEQVHMSIPKAVALLGLGRRNLRLLPTDARMRLDVNALARTLADDTARGRMPVAIVASAGTVMTGAVDPLEPIAAVAREHGCWLHVDGAYGALAAIAAPERVPGLALADSLSLDAHKWLYQPLECGCLLFRDPAAARRAFSATGEYVRPMSADAVEGFAFFEETIELSRRFRALKLWLSLRYHGLAAFRAAIAADLAHARQLAGLVEQAPELELLAPVELSAVCFRVRSTRDHTDTDALNRAVLARVLERRRVYLSNAEIGGRFALRACFTNHRTTDGDVEEVVREVIAAAEEVR